MVRILVVDDSAADRRLAGGLLQKQDEDWELFYATDGRDALEQVELHIPDLIVTDLAMEEMNGLELVEAVRQEYPGIPVVLMTAKGSESIAVEALEKGAASYVPKSRLSKELCDAVSRQLAAKSRKVSQRRLFNRCAEQTFVLENDPDLIAALVGYLRDEVRDRRLLSESDSLRIGTALDEALQNAYFHGNLEVESALRESDDTAYFELAQQRRHEDPYRDRRIHVTARYSWDDVRFVVRDEGPGFVPEALPDPTDESHLDRPCGRGVFLMRTFMDEVDFNETGNEVTLVKHRSAERMPDVEEESGDDAHAAGSD